MEGIYQKALHSRYQKTLDGGNHRHWMADIAENKARNTKYNGEVKM